MRAIAGSAARTRSGGEARWIRVSRWVESRQTYALIGEVAHPGAARLGADARIESSAGKLHARATGRFLPNQAFDPTRPA